MGSLLITSKPEVSTLPFDYILRCLVDFFPQIVSLSKSVNLAFYDLPASIKHHLSRPPLTLSPEQRKEFKRLPVLSDAEENANYYPKPAGITQTKRERILKTKERVVEYVGRIALIKSPAPSEFDWQKYQEWRFGEFEKLESVRNAIRDCSLDSLLLNRNAIPKYKDETELPIDKEGKPNQYLPVKAFNTPYVRQIFLIGKTERNHDLIIVEFEE